MTSIRTLAIAVAIALASLVVAGCGGDDEASDSAAQSADGELTQIKVGGFPIVGDAAIRLGIEQGFFEEEGLDVEIELYQSEATMIPAIVSGEIAIGNNTVIAALQAASKDVPIRMLAANTRNGEPVSNGRVIVEPDSGMTSIADLEGKRVGVPGRGGFQELIITVAMKRAGADPSTVKWVVLPLTTMGEAVTGGRVDAAMNVEPLTSLAIASGLEALADPYKLVDPDMLTAVWTTSESYAEESPEVAEGFQRAIAKSNAYAESNPDEVRRMLATYTELPPAVIEETPFPRWVETFDVDELERQVGAIADLMVEADLAPSRPDVPALVVGD